MAAYYFEGAKILAPITFRSNEPIYDSETVSLKKQRASQNVQRWELSFETILTTDSPDSFVANLTKGITSTATMIMPQLKPVVDSTTVGGTPHVGTATSRGNISINMDTDTAFGVVPKGAFVKFSNHDKVYVVTQEIDFNTTVDRTLHIYPSLRADVPVGTLLQTGDSCVLTYYRDISSLRGITFTDGMLSNEGTITVIEAV